MSGGVVSAVRAMQVDGRFGYGFVILDSVALLFGTEQEAAAARDLLLGIVASTIHVKGIA